VGFAFRVPLVMVVWEIDTGGPGGAGGGVGLGASGTR